MQSWNNKIQTQIDIMKCQQHTMYCEIDKMRRQKSTMR